MLMDRDEMNNLVRGSSIDASYQVSVHLAKRFQRTRFYSKSTNQKQEWPVAAMFVNGSGRNEQSYIPVNPPPLCGSLPHGLGLLRERH